MGHKKVQSAILLVIGIMHLIGGVYLLHCPRYTKYEAIQNGWLDDRAICRSAKLGNDEDICLNGFISLGRYCATGSCNIFGYNCDGHCLTGSDNLDDKDDYKLKCDTTAFLERENVCAYYKDQFDTFSTKSKTEMSGYFPPDRKGTATKGLYGWIDTKSLEDNMKTVCPWYL